MSLTPNRPSLEIFGPASLAGEIPLQGDKTAALLLIAAAAARPGGTTLLNVPEVTDVAVGVELARRIRPVELSDGVVRMAPIGTPPAVVELPPVLCSSIRHTMSFVAAGIRLGSAVAFSLPGGDQFCARPVDVHLRVLRAAGVAVDEVSGRLLARQTTRRSFDVSLRVDGVGPSVGATATAIILAAGVEAESRLAHASRDPQVDVIRRLVRQSGGCVDDAGEAVLIRGARSDASEVEIQVPGDRIALATFGFLAAACRGPISLLHAAEALDSATQELLLDAGVTVGVEGDAVSFGPGSRSCLDVRAAPFPAISTDALPLAAAFSACTAGTSLFRDAVYPDRTTHLPVLHAFGIEAGAFAGGHFVSGSASRPRAAVVSATDIRAGAAAFHLALTARGRSRLYGVSHVLRGYANWTNILRSLGADLRFRV